MTPMIEQLIGIWNDSYASYMAWYSSADILTQYMVIIASGVVLFLITFLFLFSKITR